MKGLRAGVVSLVIIAAMLTAIKPREAQARRGGWIAAAVVGGIVLHHALRHRHYYGYRRHYGYRRYRYRRYYRRRHYRRVYYRPYRYRRRYYRPRYYRRAPRCIRRYGRRYCRW